MWCQNCGQDVPAVYSSELSAYCCGRCMGMLPREPHFPSADGVTASNSPEVLHSLDRSRGEGRPGSEAYDAWGMEQQLHHLSRRIRGGGPRRTQRTTPNASPGAPMPASKPALRRTTWATYPEWNWGVLAFGMMASLCGLALSGWSIFTTRAGALECRIPHPGRGGVWRIRRSSSAVGSPRTAIKRMSFFFAPLRCHLSKHAMAPRLYILKRRNPLYRVDRLDQLAPIARSVIVKGRFGFPAFGR